MKRRISTDIADDLLHAENLFASTIGNDVKQTTTYLITGYFEVSDIESFGESQVQALSQSLVASLQVEATQVSVSLQGKYALYAINADHYKNAHSYHLDLASRPLTSLGVDGISAIHASESILVGCNLQAALIIQCEDLKGILEDLHQRYIEDKYHVDISGIFLFLRVDFLNFH